MFRHLLRAPKRSNTASKTKKNRRAGVSHRRLLCESLEPRQLLSALAPIAFYSYRDGNGDIYAMNPDGTDQTRLTSNSSAESYPAFSPDGSKIAFCSGRDGRDEIYVMNADGTGQTRLTNNSANDYAPAFSPDASKIAFYSDRDGHNEVYVMDADGTGQTRLTDNSGASNGSPRFSPDGSKIVFASDRDGNAEIYVMNADGSNQTRLTSTSSAESFPAFSPDGTKIVFDSTRDSSGVTNYELYVMNADGTGQTRLTVSNEQDFGPVYSPDGSKIAFVSNRDGNYQIYVMNADGSNQTKLTSSAGGNFYPTWAGDISPPTQTSRISGQVFNDLDGDGIGDAGELGLEGWTVFVDSNNNGQLDANETFTQTNADGEYSLTDLAPGIYTVAEVPQTGWKQTSPYSPGGQLLQTFHMPAPDSGYDGYGDRFGCPVVPLGDDMVLVGAHQAGGVGKAYLFDVDTGNLLHTFENPAAGAGDNFGMTIATMGDTVLIGAPMNAFGYSSGAGAVYVFTHTGPTWNNWSSQTISGPAAGANLGISIAVVGDNILIGASGDHAGQPGGAAYLYSGSDFSLIETFSNPSATAGAGFGLSVAGSETAIVIGAQGVGIAYLYRYDGSSWSAPEALSNPSGNSGELFGTSVALIGGNVLVGAPYDNSDGNQGGAAYLLDGSTKDVIHKFDNPHQGPGYAGLGARFGTQVLAVGDNVYVAAPWDDAASGRAAGAGYVFDGSTWNLLLTMPAKDPTGVFPEGDFGQGASAMGNNILVGDVYADDTAPNSGAAYLFSGPGAGSHSLTLTAGQVATGLDFGNHRPTAEAGGPYAADEGTDITLDASGSTDGANDFVRYEWDFDNDGQYDDALGATGTFHAIDDGTYPIGLRVTDAIGAWSTDTATLTVSNVAPTVTINDAPATSPEGTSITLTASATDPSPVDQAAGFNYLWSVTKDGNPYPVPIIQILLYPSSFSFVPDDNGLYEVTLVAVDKDNGASRPDTVSIPVGNVAPTLTVTGDGTVAEGSLYTLTLGPVVDPGTDTVSQYVIHWGDGANQTILAADLPANREITHTYADGPSSPTITADLTDEDGTYLDVASKAIQVTNVSPSNLALSLSASTINENDSTTLSGSFVDPGVLDTHTVTIDWGDGSDVTTLSLGAGVVSFADISHTYLDDGPSPGNGTPSDVYTVTVSVADKDQPEETVDASIGVTVNNVTPVITSIENSASGGGSAAEGQPVTVSGTFTEVGTLDRHTAKVNWGDGSTTDAQILESNGSGSLQASHAYASGGVYTIAVTLNDDDTGADTRNTLAVVSSAGIQDGTLYVVGTDNDDHVTINKQGNGLLKVHANFFPESDFRTFDAAGIHAIVVLLYGGNDQATIAGNITTPVLLDGGSGNDHLNGGGGPNILLGGIGDDELIGGDAADILLGGLGRDRLVGSGGDDILVAGSATVDPDPAESGQRFDQALLSLVAEWNGSKVQRTIRSRLHATDDGVEDVLTGSAGQDWFFARTRGNARDRILGRSLDESLDELG